MKTRVWIIVVALLVGLAGLSAAAPFVPVRDRSFDHDRHVKAVAGAGKQAASCATCHNLTPAGDPVVKGKAEHGRCFAACHDHQYGVSCGALSTGGKSGPGKGVCLVCHDVLLSSCNPPGLVPQAKGDSFTEKFGHSSPGHFSPVVEKACSSCHPTQAGTAAAASGPHLACAQCHAQKSKPAMNDCASCHVAVTPKAPVAIDPFRATGFEHGKHLATAKTQQCFTCHQQQGGEALRPTMKTCELGCHDGKKAFSTTGAKCTACHKTTAPPVAARTVEDFSHGKHAPRGVNVAACGTCHTVEKDGTTPPALRNKEHMPCATAGCHADDFAVKQPRICGNCHNSASPWSKNTARLIVPDPSRPSEWTATFGHASHLAALVGNAKDGNPNAVCTSCHGDVFAGTSSSRGHAACIQCHGSQQKPLIADCGACHTRDAASAGKTSEWSVAATFKHTNHGNDPRTRAATKCAQCHDKVGQSTSLATLGAPAMQRCDGCHDGTLAFKTTGFGCVRCHGKSQVAAVSK